MPLDWGCPHNPANDIDLIARAEMDSHRQSIALIEGKMGFKRQPSFTDVLGFTLKFLAEEQMAAGSINNGTIQFGLACAPGMISCAAR